MRSLLLTLLLAAGTWVAAGQPARADDADALKAGEIWRHCEHYFLTVEHHKARADNYAIRDVSLEFVRTIKRFKPAGDREAFLYSECVNLASGNATQAHDAVQRELAEDSEFFETARIDAENNANASRFEYTEQLDGQSDLELEVEAADDAFRNLLEIERQRSMSVIVRPFAQGGGGNVDFGISGNTTLNPFAAWRRFASPARAPQPAAGSSGSGGTAAAQTYGSSAVTIAPVTPPAGGAPAPSSGATPAPSGEPPQSAALQRARHLAPACASYRVTEADLGLARVTNHCAEPIAFHWCWVAAGRSDCAPNLLSGVIAGGQTETIPEPEENEQALAVYVVCDMTDRQHLCLR